MPDQVWLGHFNIVAGQVQEDGPYAGAAPDRPAADAIADLYVVLQPTRPDTDQLCAGVMETVTRAFGHAQYSVTGNLLLALGQAAQNLREWNRASLPEHRMGIGVSALAIAGDDAYVGQAGPALAFYRHHGRVEQLVPLELEARTPLGEAETLGPWFHRLKLEQGDAILLLSGGLAARAEPGLIEHSLSLTPEAGLPEIFRAARGVADGGALLVCVLGDLAPQATDDDDDDADRDAAQLRRLPATPESGRSSSGRADRREAPLSEPPIKPEKQRRPPSPLGRNPFRRVNAVHPDKGDGVLRIIGSEKPRRPFTGPKHALATSEDVLAAAAKFNQMNVRVRDDHPGFRSAFGGLGGRRRSLRPFLLGGGVAVALAAALWLGVPALVDSGRTQKFATLLRSSQSQLSTAHDEADLAKRRELLTQALSNVDEARRLRPHDDRAVSQATSVADALSVLDAVLPLDDVPTLANLSSVGLSNSSTVEVAAGDAFYVLDVIAGKVFAVPRDKTLPPEVVYEDGSDIDGVKAGKARHIVWNPAATVKGSGTLLILDAGHHLFGLTANDLRAIPLRGADQWRSDTAMALWGGDLYILDAAAGAVWRYAPSGAGFDTDPAPAVARADIRDTNGIAVIGGVFLTGQDGRIRRFLSGEEAAFKLAGIDKSPAAPPPPLYDTATGALYLADRGNSRIIVLEANGNFKRQLTHVKLAGLRGATVDPGQNRLIGIIGQNLVAIALPR